MRIATWNVNSIIARLPNVTRWLEQTKPDVLCMQETKCTDDKFPREDFEKLGYQCLMFGQQSYNGVAILSRNACDVAQRGYPDDQDPVIQSRLLAATVGGIRLVNVYIPNGERVGSEKYEFKLNWLRRLRSFLDTHYDKSSPVILCGDFNVAHQPIDIARPKENYNKSAGYTQQEIDGFSTLLNAGFVDTFRARVYHKWFCRSAESGHGQPGDP